MACWYVPLSYRMGTASWPACMCPLVTVWALPHGLLVRAP